MNPLFERAAEVANAMQLLADATSKPGKALRTRALAESDLSAPMIEWAIETTFAGLPTDFEVLIRRAQLSASTAFVANAALVLSGNVFTAPAEPLAVHAIANVRTRIKTSSSDGSFAHAFLDALAISAPHLRELFTLHEFDRHSKDAMSALAENADVVTAYGGDETMRDIASALSPTSRLVQYGHGFGAILLNARALDLEGAALARSAALDVAAYDQRGCRSPQVIFVEGSAEQADGFARELSVALDALEQKLPRGKLGDTDRARERRWRQSMLALGPLYETETSCVVVVDDASRITTPLFRNIQVIALRALSEFEAFAHRAASRLKVVGVHRQAGSDISGRILASNRHTTIVDVGSMQTPHMHDSALLYALAAT